MSDLYFSIRKSFLTAEESREFPEKWQLLYPQISLKANALELDASNACGE
jgi:hypothetical protein